MASRLLSCAAASFATPPKHTGLSDSTTCYPSLLLLPSTSTVAKLTLRNGSLKCKAIGDQSSQTPLDRTVYQGIYGPWTVDSSDVREVNVLSYFSLLCLYVCLSTRSLFYYLLRLFFFQKKKRLLIIRVKYFMGYDNKLGLNKKV